jgi:hypothetical protein
VWLAAAVDEFEFDQVVSARLCHADQFAFLVTIIHTLSPDQSQHSPKPFPVSPSQSLILPIPALLGLTRNDPGISLVIPGVNIQYCFHGEIVRISGWIVSRCRGITIDLHNGCRSLEV